jgi:hypothetical protein
MNDIILKIVTPFLASLVAILLYSLKKKDDELSLIKNKISEEKYRTYFAVTSLFFDLMKQNKRLIKFEDGELSSRYIDIKKNLLLLGSDEVIKKFTEFDKNMMANNPNPMVTIKHWLELFILIRKDSGNPKTQLTIEDILKAIVEEADYLSVAELIKKAETISVKKQ